MTTARTRLRSIVTACVVASVGALVLAMTPVASAAVGRQGRARQADPYTISLNLPPRLQWNANDGYCGEVSFISAGLYYGQYLSQYDARAIASSDTPQYKPSSQLLLGANSAHAADAMRLGHVQWQPGTGATTADFLTWVKTQLIEGHPVAIGVYTNENAFYGSTDPDAGDPSYDHIVDVTGISSQHPLTLPATYYSSDTLTFNDNGLWTGTPSGRPQYRFTYPFGAFQASRRQANAPGGDIYSLADATRDYGIAFTGPADSDDETVPVNVATSANDESPDISNGSNARPAAMALTLTVTVSGLHAGETYTLYRYDSVTSVPRSAFNANHAAAAAQWTFTATGPTFTLSQPIVSSDEVIYRAVPADAP